MDDTQHKNPRNEISRKQKIKSLQSKSASRQPIGMRFVHFK